MASSESDDLNWQVSRRTLVERNKFMFNNSLMSDVKFIVPKSDSNSVDKKKLIIPAHKYVLAISSPVFFAMFYGELAEKGGEIELPDCESESFLEFLRCLYYDDIGLTGNCVMGVFYLARKYMVPSLTERCSEYLRDNLSAENVFSVLPLAQKYEDEHLVTRCWEIVDRKTEDAVKSEAFFVIEKSFLKSVLERDSLSVEEVELFKAVDCWAERECVKQGLPSEGKEKRKVLGEEIVSLIRFPIMSLKSFSVDVVGKNILRKQEISSVLQHLHGVKVRDMNFPVNQRSTNLTQSCQRFSSCSFEYGWNYGGSPDTIQFTVDRNISLLGLQLFGSKDGEYSSEVLVRCSNVRLAQKSRSSKSIKGTEGYYCFDVYFDHPVALQANETYLVEARISGPFSYYGQGGIARVQTKDVLFQFCTPNIPGTSTSASIGQFPKLYFALRN